MNKTDIIVVGGGPAGICAAISARKAGAQVVLIERGRFSGSKNVFGGAIYSHAVREIFPEFEATAPLERKIIEHKFALLGEKDSTVVSYHNADAGEAYSVERGKFDRWMAAEAAKAGVTFVTETVVRELIMQDGRVIGVRTELEEYFAKTVIIAEGANSLLTEQIGLRGRIEPEDIALSVKEVFKLDTEKINERFGVTSDEGCVYQIFGGPMLGMVGLGFLYINKKSISIGAGIALDELMKRKIKPYDVLDELKNHPTIARLLKDAVLLEYSAHLIPEGGYKKMPKLSAPGVLVTGDAGMLVNNVHWEGTNLAMISGKIAGEVAASGDLSGYEKTLKESFVMKDLRTYRDVMGTMHKHSNSFLGYYPRKINSFFEMFTQVDGVPKRKKYREFIKSFFTQQNFLQICKDAFAMLKLVWSVLK